MKMTAQKISNIECNLLDELTQPMQIGSVTVPNRVFLAPMSGISDVPFRKRASEAGAGLVISEMVASQELVSGSSESQMRALSSGSGVHMVQLAGREAYWMGEAARQIEASGADIIDINMGCPAKKVTGGYSGSALMRDLDHAMTLVEATVSAVKVPVTLKMRLGWDDGTINAPELAKRAQDAGVQMITVHGRTRCQFYEGRADWAAVRAVRDVVTVPMVVNGDIQTLENAEQALEYSGADAVMLGRAHYGKPWASGDLVKSIQGLGGTSVPFDMASYVITHYQDMLSAYGIKTGVRHARKHLNWYLERHAHDVPVALRLVIMTENDPQKVISALNSALGDFQTVGELERHVA
jgi:nifR3 family TIM-barrel protein